VEEQVLCHIFVKEIQKLAANNILSSTERAELASLILQAVSARKRRFWDTGMCLWESKNARSALKTHSDWRVSTLLFNLVGGLAALLFRPH
jgi:hypothetical protein